MEEFWGGWCIQSTDIGGAAIRAVGASSLTIGASLKGQVMLTVVGSC